MLTVYVTQYPSCNFRLYSISLENICVRGQFFDFMYKIIALTNNSFSDIELYINITLNKLLSDICMSLFYFDLITNTIHVVFTFNKSVFRVQF